jgi:hypothetical protein
MLILTGCTTIKGIFKKDLKENFSYIPENIQVLQQSEISHLPSPVQRYLIECGFVGHEKTYNARVVWKESHIMMRPGSKWMKLKTEQYNSVDHPFRIAYMKARIMGIVPFEGRDLFCQGRGHMLGWIANTIRIFDEDNPEIAQSALTIILAEALLIPGYALSEYITWQAVDDHSAQATINYQGLQAMGMFFFDDQGKMIRFETRERYYRDPQKGNIFKPFTAYVGDYIKQGDLTIPTSLVAAWQLEQGEFRYWKGKIERVDYNLAALP